MIDQAIAPTRVAVTRETLMNGRDIDPLFSPSSLAILGDGSLLITHELGHQVWHMNSDLSLRATFGSFGNGPGQFYYPSAVASDRDGMIVVADKWNHRVQLFDEHMRHVRSIGRYGSNEGCLSEPSGVACGHGMIYIADKTNGRMIATDYGGKVLAAYVNNNPLPQFFSGKTFKANQHYLGWLTQCSRFYTMLDQFVLNGFKVGLLEYPESVMVVDDKVCVLDKVSHHCVALSRSLEYREVVAVHDVEPTCCAYSPEMDRWWFGSEYERVLVSKQGIHAQIIEGVQTKCAAIAVAGDVLYAADFWDGVVTKYRIS